MKSDLPGNHDLINRMCLYFSSALVILQFLQLQIHLKKKGDTVYSPHKLKLLTQGLSNSYYMSFPISNSKYCSCKPQTDGSDSVRVAQGCCVDRGIVLALFPRPFLATKLSGKLK